jgi:hypothetical protein
MLLLILIPTAWLSVIALLVALCRNAAAGDRTGWPEQSSPVSIGPKLVLSGGLRESPSPAASPPRRPHARRALSGHARHVRRTRAAHVSR